MCDPLVSVVIPFLNSELYLAEAIQSVHRQTSVDWELILVDDGSTDRSVSMARGWVAAEPDRIRLLHHAGHENRGMSASRNLGLAAARGEFVAYLDSDDVWESNALATRVDELRRWPTATMAYGPALYWWSWRSDTEAQDRLQRLGPWCDELVQPPTLAMEYLRQSAVTPQLGTALFRRHALTAVGGSEDDFRGMYEDQVLALKFAAAHPVFVSAAAICKYRQHETSACAVSFAEGTHMRERIRFTAWAERYLSGLEPRNPQLERIARQERRKAAAPASRLRGLRRAIARVAPRGALRFARRTLYGDE